MSISIGSLAYRLRRLKSDCFPNRGDNNHAHMDAKPASLANSNRHRDSVPHKYACRLTLRNTSADHHPSSTVND